MDPRTSVLQPLILPHWITQLDLFSTRSKFWAADASCSKAKAASPLTRDFTRCRNGSETGTVASRLTPIFKEEDPVPLRIPLS